MSEVHSEGKRKMWANKTKEERFLIMSKVAKAKQAKMTPEQRTAHAYKMIQGKVSKSQALS